MSEEKTEEPTPRRLRKAAEEGDTGGSAFFSQWVGFVVGTALLPGGALALFAYAETTMTAAIRGDVKPTFGAIARDVAVLSVPILLAVAVASSAASIVQGGSLSFRSLRFDTSKLDPVKGVSGLFSRARLFSVARALALAALAFVLALLSLKGHLRELVRSRDSISATTSVAGLMIRELFVRTCVVGLGVAFVDLVVVRSAWRRRLRMSRNEVRREHREQEGNAEEKAARERLHRELLSEGVIASVRKATVLVVNPTHIATALRYDVDAGDEAPLLLGSGQGELAERMIAEAHRFNVPVVRDVPLARALVELTIGEEIPEALYEGVAAILEEAWAMSEETGGKP